MKKVTGEELLVILEDAKEMQKEMYTFCKNIMLGDPSLSMEQAQSVFYIIKLSDMTNEIDKLKHTIDINNILDE